MFCAQALAQQGIDLTLPTVTILAPTPLLGSGVDRDSVPAASATLRTRDLTRAGTAPADAVRSLNETTGTNLDSASGNPFQPTLFFHGFSASALQGTAQGLAVYVNGVRFNQAFGDTVNFDLLPNMAIERLDVEGSNPVFGLNALGGSINIKLRDGFTWQGAEAEISGGSFGTVSGNFQWGQRSGDTATYVAGGVTHQGGWRDQQSSDLQTLYGDIGWRGRGAELHLNTTLAHSALNGPGTAPVELLAVAPAAQFTAPNFIGNRFAQVSLSGSASLTDTISVQGVSYYSNFLQRVMNGNAPNDTPCNDGSGLLCNDDTPSTTRGGATIPAFLGPDPLAYSELDVQTTNTDRYGVSAQVTDTGKLFGLDNHLVAGASYDGAATMFTASAAIGGIDPYSRDFVGPGVVIDEPGVSAPVRVSVGDSYYGLFITDTLHLTDRLSVTASGRFNLATIDLSDRNGGDLSGNHRYQRFNPAVGATYKIAPWLSVYAGYAEANRAPTPAELSCAGPANSCSLANFFVGDPSLKQVVAHTIEAGLRGSIPRGEDRIAFDLGFYRTGLDDDIAFVNSTGQNRAYFANIGQTQRQGVDLSLRYTAHRWSAWIAYAYTDATFRSGFTEAAGNNPAADASGSLTVQPGNHLPGIPAHQGKLGVTWKISDDWTVAAVLVAQSGQYLFGDDANLTPKLPAFFHLTLSTAYQVTQQIELFGSIDNATDERYYTYGTFAPTAAVALSQAPGATNPRAYSAAAPIGVFGGVRVRF